MSSPFAATGLVSNQRMSILPKKVLDRIVGSSKEKEGRSLVLERNNRPLPVLCFLTTG